MRPLPTRTPSAMSQSSQLKTTNAGVRGSARSPAGVQGAAPPGLSSMIMAQMDVPTRFSMPGVRVFIQSTLFWPTGALMATGS
jgi:hypothetical protein